MFSGLFGARIFMLGSFVFFSAVARANIVEFKPASGAHYLNVFAASCEQKSWTAIETWAKRNAYSKLTMPAMKFTYDGTSVKSADNKAKMLYKADGSIDAEFYGRKFSGSLCEVALQLVQPKPPVGSLSAGSSLSSNVIAVYLQFLASGAAIGCSAGSLQVATVPAAQAQVPARRHQAKPRVQLAPVKPTLLQACSSSAVVGVLAGLNKVYTIADGRHINREKFSAFIENFNSSSPALYRCAGNATLIDFGKRRVVITDNASGSYSIKAYEDRKLTLELAEKFNELSFYRGCVSEVLRDRTNIDLKSNINRLRTRLPKPR